MIVCIGGCIQWKALSLESHKGFVTEVLEHGLENCRNITGEQDKRDRRIEESPDLGRNIERLIVPVILDDRVKAIGRDCINAGRIELVVKRPKDVE